MGVIGYQCHLCGFVEMSIQDHLRKKCGILRPLPQTAPALDPNRSDDKTAKSPPVTKSPSVAKSPPVTAMLLAESKESTPPAAKKLKPESSHAVSPPATKQLKTDVSDAVVSPPANKKLKPESSDTASSPAVQSPWIWIDVPGSDANGDAPQLKCIECGMSFSKLPRLEEHYMEVHVETSDQPSSTETCPICNIRLVDTYTTGCFFLKVPPKNVWNWSRDGRCGEGGVPRLAPRYGEGGFLAPPRPVKRIQTAGKLRGKIKAQISTFSNRGDK